MLKIQKITTSTPEQTLAQGKRFAKKLLLGNIVLLDGELGAGKTTFAKGIVLGILGVQWAKQVSSPTYTMVHEYVGKQRILHLDLYRLDAQDTSQDEEIMSLISNDTILLVEWASKRKHIFDKSDWVVTLTHAGFNKRELLLVKK